MAGSSPLSNCLHCKAPFVADRRNRGRQRFCRQPDCRAASKRSSQRAWLSKPANSDYFKGPANSQRVHDWRALHPGYWKRSRPAKRSVPQESSPPEDSQPVEPQGHDPRLPPVALQDPFPGALQDSFPLHHPLVVGLIAIHMGSALQEDILRHCDVVAAKGREILRHGAAGPPVPA